MLIDNIKILRNSSDIWLLYRLCPTFSVRENSIALANTIEQNMMDDRTKRENIELTNLFHMQERHIE